MTSGRAEGTNPTEVLSGRAYYYLCLVDAVS